MTTEQYSIGYDQGYQDGMNDALAPQPVKQTPVAFYRCNGCGHAYELQAPSSCDCMEGTGFSRIEYYAAPVQQVDLTDDEIVQAVGSPLDEVYLADFRAVIAAYKEKNK